MAIGQTPDVEHKLKSSDDSHDAEIDHISELASQIAIHDDGTTKTIDALRRRTRYADLSGVEEGTLIVFDRYYRFRTATLAMRQSDSISHHTEDDSKNKIVLQDYSHNFELHTSASRPYILFGTAGTPITMDLLEELVRFLLPGAFIDVEFALPVGHHKITENPEGFWVVDMMKAAGLEISHGKEFPGSIELELVKEIGQGRMDDWDGITGERSLGLPEVLEHYGLWKDALEATMYVSSH
ncbi:hypothetical protein CTAM01_17233 [Colletotrichum tamarilloi]|uniref:NmrA-like domain-containing protein n=1 Tax=Colletotrichum tamarilloi TaxID=1209934 RepID=A0ABQ9QG75_9PEZI|nr:uncharacterized protein CTAM01_17233 [Colletotrichum tamarilloi]KAK1454404.1 hypothetical protein CTAM01_17233 [Colletotrichum tamarilloi]